MILNVLVVRKQTLIHPALFAALTIQHHLLQPFPSPFSESVVRVFVSLISFLMLPPVVWASDFDELVQNVPRGANAIMAIDVAGTLATPIAKMNGWDKKLSDSQNVPLFLPPEADKVLAAAQLDIVRNFQRAWDVTQFGLTESIPLRLVARAEGGYVDSIEGTDVVWIPSDAYVLQAGEKTLVMQAPANRQAVARWMERKKSSSMSGISDFLRVALAAIEGNPHIVMALDAQDAPQTHRVKQKLQESGFVEEHSLNLDEMTGLISGLRGVVLEITLTDTISATARIHFSEMVSLNSAVAKAFVLTALDARQMSLPGIEKWKCSIVDRTIVMDGELPMESLRRLLSLMEPPSTKFSSLKEANIESPSDDDTAKRSLAYFQATQTLMKDLRQKAGSFNTDAYWIERYAKKIDNLSILHVDDDLLDYGQKLSETLRVMSGTRRMTNLQGGVAARNDRSGGGISYNSGYGYDSYSYSSPQSRENAAGNDVLNAAASGSAVKLQGWNAIDNATTEIRRNMTKRYNIEF